MKLPSSEPRRRLTPKKRAPLIGLARRQGNTDVAADGLVDMGGKVVAVRKALRRRRRGQAVDQRLSVRIEDPCRFELRQRIGELLQAAVQGRLARADDVVGHAAHHLVDLGEAAVDGLEHLERMLMRDIEGALDLAVGDIFRRGVGDRGGDREQRNRQRQGRSHHPLQQSQRIALCALHGRSGPTPESLLEFRAGKEAACGGNQRLQPACLRAQGCRQNLLEHLPVVECPGRSGRGSQHE